jgi:hypothetical protein
MMIVRRLLIGLIALAVAVQLVRNAVVQALAETRPAEAARIWPGHPDAELASGLIAIATATRERTAILPIVFSEILDAARKAPLAPEPFLVRGVQAQLAGNGRLAEQAFLAAKLRDGRSLPARYFLADFYFRHGDSTRGLPEIGVLARLAPNGVQNLAPYVAAYAKNRSTWPQLKALFATDPRLEAETLVALAADPRNTEAVLALANPGRINPSSLWLAPLLQNLIKDGQYDRARAIWASVSRIRLDRSPLIFDPGFTRRDASPPFGWALTSSTVGFAERQRGGGLHVIFYGQEDGALASQLLVLAPGHYRLMTNAPGALRNVEALQWRLTCQGAAAPFASVPLSASISGWTFTVAPGCGAQKLDLFGSSADIPKQSEATIRSLNIAAERPNA